MGIDNETKPTEIRVLIEDNEKYINSLKDKRYGIEGVTGPVRCISEREHCLSDSHVSYNAADNEIKMSFMMLTPLGRTQVILDLPLSDTVLIDIMQNAIKRFNTIKKVMEQMQ